MNLVEWYKHTFLPGIGSGIGSGTYGIICRKCQAFFAKWLCHLGLPSAAFENYPTTLPTLGAVSLCNFSHSQGSIGFLKDIVSLLSIHFPFKSIAFQWHPSFLSPVGRVAHDPDVNQSVYHLALTWNYFGMNHFGRPIRISSLLLSIWVYLASIQLQGREGLKTESTWVCEPRGW